MSEIQMRDDATLSKVLTFFLQENADRLTPAQMELAAVFLLGEMEIDEARQQFQSVGIKVTLPIEPIIHWHVEFR
jgi:hypothetical protein